MTRRDVNLETALIYAERFFGMEELQGESVTERFWMMLTWGETNGTDFIPDYKDLLGKVSQRECLERDYLFNVVLEYLKYYANQPDCNRLHPIPILFPQNGDYGCRVMPYRFEGSITLSEPVTDAYALECRDCIEEFYEIQPKTITGAYPSGCAIGSRRHISALILCPKIDFASFVIH